MFSGNMVQYLWAPSSLFSWSWSSWKKKKKPGESTSSSWTNTTAYSIPEAQTLPLCSPSERSDGHAGFICSGRVGDEDNVLCSAPLFRQCGRGGCVCSLFSGRRRREKKRRQNRLIPTTSCLWRQEEVTVAALFLSTQAWMCSGRHVAPNTRGHTESGALF